MLPATQLPRSPSPAFDSVTQWNSPTFTSELNRTRPRTAIQVQHTPTKRRRTQGRAGSGRETEMETLESSSDEDGVTGLVDETKRRGNDIQKGTRRRKSLEKNQEHLKQSTRKIKRSLATTSSPPPLQPSVPSRSTSTSSSNTFHLSTELPQSTFASLPHSSLTPSDINDSGSEDSDDGSVSFNLVPSSLRPHVIPNLSTFAIENSIDLPTSSDSSGWSDLDPFSMRSARREEGEAVQVVGDEEIEEKEKKMESDSIDSPVNGEPSTNIDDSIACDTVRSGIEAPQSDSTLPPPSESTNATITPNKNDSSTTTTPKPRCTPEEIEAKRLAALERRRSNEERLARLRREEEQQRLGASKLAEYERTSDYDSPTNEGSDESSLSEEQKEILELVRQGKNVFITGSAGVGKSFTLAKVTELLTALRRKFSITAPTGIAAINVGGNTIHSWAGVGLAKESIAQLYNKISAREAVKESWTKSDVLIIDEVSMVHPLLFTKLNILGQLLRKDPRPFGGLQLIACGDYFQLAPVDIELLHEMTCVRCGKLSLQDLESPQSIQVPRGSERTRRYRCTEFLDEKRKRKEGCGIVYEIPTFAFETAAWKSCGFEIVELTKVFRQAHQEFVRILEKIRRGIRDPACLQFFKGCGKALQSGSMKIKPTVLYPARSEVETENMLNFDKLSGKVYSFKSRDEAFGDYAQENMASRLKDMASPELLRTKIGAQVMLVVNLDPKLGLVNGTRGVIVDFVRRPSDYDLRWNVKDSKNGNENQVGSDKWKAEASVRFLRQQEHDLIPVVHFGIGKHGVRKDIIPQTNTINFGEKLGMIARTQIPLQLAWALTIHKSQGRSLDAVATNLQRTFANGQAYVALSRARTPEGMRVDGFSLDKIKASPTVKRFYEAIASKSPFPISSIAPTNPLDYLLFDQRRLLDIEEVFDPKPPSFDMYDDLLAEDPIDDPSSPGFPFDEPSKPSTTSIPNPISVSSTSTLSFSLDDVANTDPADSMLQLAKQYVATQKASGVLGGFVLVDEEGFVEAARTAIRLATAQSRERQVGGSATSPTKRLAEEFGVVDEGQESKRPRRNDISRSTDSNYAMPTTRSEEMQLRSVQAMSFETGYGGRSYRRGDAEGWDSGVEDGEQEESSLDGDGAQDTERAMGEGQE